MSKSNFGIFSPYVASVFSLIIFIVSFLLPSSVYEELLGERSSIHLDFYSAFYVVVCCAFFNFGLMSYGAISKSLAIKVESRPSFLVGDKFYLLPLLFFLAYAIYSAYTTIANYPFVMDVFLGDGRDVKESPEVQDFLGLAHFLLSGVVCWVVYRISEKRFVLKRPGLIYFFIGLSVLVMCFSSLISMARGALFPMIIGIVVSSLLPRWTRGSISAASVVKYFIFGLVFIFLVFFIFSFLRGADDTDRYLSDIFGYIFSSYNRLSLILDGRLSYPYAGSGVYFSGFLSFNKSLNQLLPISEYFGWGDYYSVWMSEFYAVHDAGLNGTLIWSSIFGYLYSDFGWFSIWIFYLYGLLYSVIWKLAISGNSYGVIVYPWFLFCILFWFGSNYLLDTKMIYLIILSFFLDFYEKYAAFERRENTNEGR